MNRNRNEKTEASLSLRPPTFLVQVAHHAIIHIRRRRNNPVCLHLRLCMRLPCPLLHMSSMRPSSMSTLTLTLTWALTRTPAAMSMTLPMAVSVTVSLGVDVLVVLRRRRWRGWVHVPVEVLELEEPVRGFVARVVVWVRVGLARGRALLGGCDAPARLPVAGRACVDLLLLLSRRAL